MILTMTLKPNAWSLNTDLRSIFLPTSVNVLIQYIGAYTMPKLRLIVLGVSI